MTKYVDNISLLNTQRLLRKMQSLRGSFLPHPLCNWYITLTGT